MSEYPQMSECQHDNYDDYFEKCTDCDLTKEEIEQELEEQGKCLLCGQEMNANCNNANCDGKGIGE